MADPKWPTGDIYDHTLWSAGRTYTLLSAGTVQCSSALSAGLHVICADTYWHFLQGNFTSGTTSQVQASTTDMPLAPFEKKYVWVSSETEGGANGNGDDAVSGKCMTGAAGGSFWVARVR